MIVVGVKDMKVFMSCVLLVAVGINGPPAENRDLTTKYETLKVMHI